MLPGEVDEEQPLGARVDMGTGARKFQIDERTIWKLGSGNELIPGESARVEGEALQTPGLKVNGL